MLLRTAKAHRRQDMSNERKNPLLRFFNNIPWRLGAFAVRKYLGDLGVFGMQSLK
jgi:hypothetical protein